MSSKLEWFAGVCDSDGSVIRTHNTEMLTVSNVNKEFMLNTLLLLQTMGITSKIGVSYNEGLYSVPDQGGGRKMTFCKTLYKLFVSSNQVQKLLELGFSPKRLQLSFKKSLHDNTRYIKVIDIVDEGRYADTYCFTEKKRGMGMFGGVLTGQCAEIVEYSSAEEISCCNLAQLNLSQFVDTVNNTVDYDSIVEVSRHATRNLNKVIDRTFYPVEKAKLSNFKHRPLALGVSGLHDMFFKLKLASFDCPEAREINKNVFESIYRGAILESIDLAKKYGAYDTFKGSPASKGILQFDMWGIKENDLYWKDWPNIKADVVKHGLRNSLLVALMPTATSATIMGVTECFEIQTSNIYSRTVLSGDFALVNKYLVQELIELGLWNNDVMMSIMGNDGSVQHIENIPKEIKERYKTVWEYSMKSVIDMAADRGAFVDQSASLNLYLKDPTIPKLTSMHMYSWSKGLKTMSYYLRSRAATEAVKFTIRPSSQVKYEDNEVCESCSA
jgi:ribonucleotide reductase alpha subunit